MTAATETTPRRIVVVGGGIAGLTACDSLRAEGFDGELTVVGAEPHAAYSRPALSKALLALDQTLGAQELPAPTHEATELRGTSATGLDPARRLVSLSDGSTLPYDGLVIASGARARRPAVSAPAFTLRELDDALALRRALADAPSVAILGGGVLGMEIASGAIAAGCRVTLVATSPPMSRQLGPELAGMITRAATERGLRIITAHGAAIEQRGDRATIALADGGTVAADVVVCAIGDHPNVEWLRDSGLLTGSALVADSRGRIAPGIVAAGDVAGWQGPGGVQRTPLWTSAIEQAKTAASALLRGDEAPPLEFQQYFWTEQFGHSVKVIGALPGHGAPEALEGGVTETAALLRWPSSAGGFTVAAVNRRMPIPKLRRLARG